MHGRSNTEITRILTTVGLAQARPNYNSHTMTGVYLRKAQRKTEVHYSPVHFLCISHNYVCTRSFDPQYVIPSVVFTSLDLSAYKCAHTLVLSACINICTPFLSVSTSSLSCAHTFVNLSVCNSDCVHYNVVLLDLMCTVHISVRFPCHIFAICSSTIS